MFGFYEFYKRIDELSLSLDSMLALNNHTVIPTISYKAVPDESNSSPLGVDKIKTTCPGAFVGTLT